MPTFQYRTGTAADIPAAARLGLDGKLADASEDRMQRYMASKNRPQHALEPRVLLLAHDGATLVGYIVGHLTKRFDCDGELSGFTSWPPTAHAARRGAASASGAMVCRARREARVRQRSGRACSLVL